MGPYPSQIILEMLYFLLVCYVVKNYNNPVYQLLKRLQSAQQEPEVNLC